VQPPGSDYAQFINIEAAMYRDRTMMINKFIDESTANSIISIILYLRNESPKDKISLYFNVPGGLMRPSLAIYDLIQNTKKNCDIETVNLALCAGMGAVLCSAGTKGMRSSMPNARFLLQRVGMDQAFRGQATDIALEVRNMKKWNDSMELEISKLTGQPHEQVATDLRRDFYLSADEAVQYGLIDRVLLPSPRKRAARGGEADLGAFDITDEQRYQNTESGGGWGSQQQTGSPSDPKRKNKKNDDDGPEIAKG
jgi:ATP-dependent Clp protease, protease subunit